MAVAWSYTKSTNVALVTGGTSGTPANFTGATSDNAVVADRAGSVDLLAAWSPNSNTKALTYQITPADLRALLISFVVAGKTALQTDYIFITGTDAWDVAQTESINVTAGNGTYVSTKRFRTITNIDCSDNAAGGGTVWADGNVLVKQPQWGVFWDFPDVNAIRQDCQIDFGDGSTPTYFKEIDKVILLGPSVFAGGYEDVYKGRAGATVQFGQCDDATNKLVSHPCVIAFLNAGYIGKLYWFPYSTAILYEYGTIVLWNATNWGTTEFDSGGASRFWHAFHSNLLLQKPAAPADVFGLRSMSMVALSEPLCPIDRVTGISSGSSGLYFNSSLTVTVSNTDLYGYAFVFSTGSSLTGTVHLKNIRALESMWTNQWFDTGGTGQVYRENTFDLNVFGPDGVSLSGVVVDSKDQYGTACWTAGTITTDANGDIAQQTIYYQNYKAGASEPAPTVVTYSPHTFTISKAGYKTLVMENITMSESKKWHVELQPYEGAAQSRVVSIGVM